MQAVVLASGSQYRAQLLTRLGIDFNVLSPDIDESALAGEPPAILSTRLACEKAHAASRLIDQACLIIASDQVVSNGHVTLGKPGTPDRARAQLASMSGQSVEFFTSLYILETSSGRHFTALDTTRATLRMLDEQSIARYVEADNPLDCAGSFKVETLGICLFESIESQDPTALIGLPLIKTCEGLRHFGLPLP
ncbi:MAG: nucleoside triphosphate pyrophosphatase [Granulosicoccus sp.]